MSVLHLSPGPATENSALNYKKINKQKHINYEDILIDKYLEQIQQQELKNVNKFSKRIELESPYLQKLSHSNFINTIVTSSRPGSNLNSNRRPLSRNNSALGFRTNSALALRPNSGYQTYHDKFEPYFGDQNRINVINNRLHDNSNTNIQSLHLSLKGLRPSSAPVRRPGSTSTFRNNSNRNKNNYKRQPNMIRATAFRNGSRQVSAQIAARSIAEFLQFATERLQFNRAARRIFLENGDEIKNENQFLKNAIVYVSCGEDFNDPFLKTKMLIDQKKTVLWTSNGVQFISDDQNNETKINLNNSQKLPKNNDRFTRKTRLTKRLVAYPNGTEHNSALVVLEYINPALKENLTEEEIEKLEKNFMKDFLEDCTNRMNISGNARLAYNWNGDLIKTIDDVPKLDKCLQSLVNEVEYAPVWISKGEGFDARGAVFFMENLIKYTKNNRKDLIKNRKKINEKLEIVQKEIAQNRNVTIRLLELNEKLKEIGSKINDFNDSIANLESILSNLQSLKDQQTSNGYQSLFNHIKEVDTNERIFGGISSKGLKLKVFLNGTDDSFDVFFNLKDWSSSNENPDGQKNQFYQLLTEISRVYNKNNATLTKFTRLFSETGEEIKFVNKLKSHDIVWISQGENWKGPKETTFALSLSLNMLFAMRTQNDTTNFQTFSPRDKIEPENDLQADNENDANEIVNEDDQSDDDYDYDDIDEDLKKYFTKKKNKKSLVAQNLKEISKKPVTNDSYSADYNFKTYIEPLNPFALKKFDKPEHWDILKERESLERFNEIVIEFNQSLLKEEVVEIELRKASQILIHCKNDERLMLNPQLRMNLKNKLNTTKSDSIWFHHFQTWKFNKSGYIYNQFFPKICLTLNTSISIKLEIHLKPPTNSKKNKNQINQENQIIVKKGYAIVLGTRELSDKNDYRDKDQQWLFNKYGNIYSKALNEKQMLFTSTDVLLKELNNMSLQNGPIEKYELQVSETNSENYKELNSGEIGLFLLEAFDTQITPSKLTSCQKWAIKQENARSIGEWRFSELSTSLWHKLGLTWPVNEKEELIENFRWPISGYLIPGAPPLKNCDDANQNNLGTRLKVMKNGSIDFSSAVNLSRTSAKTMMKEYIHCSKLSYRQFEFNNFLDACTSALNLPNAARRIFDSQGVEHFELTNLKSDEFIFVSMGEPWIHPKLVREEQDKKIILTNLAEDLNKILYFNKLKKSQNFVIETSNMSIQDGSKLVLGQCCLNMTQIERIKKGESIQNVIEVDAKDEEVVEEEKPKKAHMISHENTDAIYAKRFRWPWEIIANKSMEGMFDKKTGESENEDDQHKDVDHRDSLALSKSFDQDVGDRFKQKSKKNVKNIKLSSQKFAFNKTHGFIYNVDYPNLVFGLTDIENNQSEVILMKKNEDNVNQRWMYRSNGLIVSKARSNLVLTVKIQALDNTDIDINSIETEQDYYSKSIIKDSLITVQPFIDFEFGNANQKWYIDETVGFIYAFATPDQKDIEITAANKAGICSYYVTYDKEISQPGYCCEFIVEQPSNNNTQENQTTTHVRKVIVCASCAKHTRGKFRLTKLSKNQNFTCFIGKSKEKMFKQYDGFKYLHGKVDLSTTECENTLIKWHSKLNAWRQETNAKTVLNELSASKAIDIIKLYAYKNGDGRLKPGEMLIGSSIKGLLEQATNRLRLNNAARRLYTEDGTLILDVHDLITWSIEFYRKELYKSDPSKKTVNTQNNKSESKSDASNSNNLLDKVDFSENPNPDGSILKNYESNDLTLNSEKSKNTKPFNGPTKSDIKKFFNEYDRTSKIDVKKLFRWPIEIWVSCGEQFVQPKLVNKIESEKMMQREQLDKVEHELEIQTHALRQMAGRRMTSMNNGQYKSIKNPDYPVVREGHWSEVTYEEQLKKEEVNKLKNFVDEIKNPKKAEKFANLNSNLYGNHPVTKRVLIYLNGESPQKAQYCWASSIEELNENCKVKLRLNKPIKFFFTQDGKIISRFEEISRDQLVCVSTGRQFISAEMRNKEVELKANWNRVKKEEGFEATNIKVSSKRNPIIDVDPFGPPILATNKSPAPALALPAPTPVNRQNKKISQELNKSIETKKIEKTENTAEISRPSTAKPLITKRKPKSKSPKRVHISKDPKDLPTIRKSIESFEIDSFESNEDVRNGFDFEKSISNDDLLNILE